MAASTEEIQCSVCLNDFDPSEIVTPAHQTCQQQNFRACRSCWQNHLQEQVAEMSRWSTGVECMSCGEDLSTQDILALATRETYDSYSEKLFRNNIRKQPGFYECPSADCQFYRLQFDEDSTTFHCERCEIEYCIICGVSMHPNETCQQYQARTRVNTDVDREATNEYLVKHTKTCPNPGCDIQVEKLDGCNVMQCDSCNHRYCWLCLASFRRSSTDRPAGSIHHETCPDHPQNNRDPEILQNPITEPSNARLEEDSQTSGSHRSIQGVPSPRQRQARVNDDDAERLQRWPPSESTIREFERHNGRRPSSSPQEIGILVAAAVGLAVISVSLFRRQFNT